MAFFVSVHKELNLVFTEYSGFLNTEQTIAALAATVDHPDYRPGMTELTQLSGITELDLDYKRMVSHSARMADHYGRQDVHTAHYVVASTDLTFGMTRMYQALAEQDVPNMTLQVFRSEREALQAMGRKETSIAELLGT